MKIGILRETKNPVDNRVALSPRQIVELIQRFPGTEIVVQPSNIRVFADKEYRECGIEVKEDLADCDVIFGIKEAKPDILLNNKHYFFFGHIAKKQKYNQHLLQEMISKKITFSDYEYLVDENGQRLCAFGWWAGIVGVYYTLRGYGLKTGLFDLPKPTLKFTLNDLKEVLSSVSFPSLRILLTGNGRVSHGAQYILEQIGAIKMEEESFLNGIKPEGLGYFVAETNKLVRRRDGSSYSKVDFISHPDMYESDFMKWAYCSDILITCHFWKPGEPIYLTPEDLCKKLPIKVIGDITCDIQGSIMSTLRSSTHDNPYYDYNPITRMEELPFSSDDNILVMAVDTCPNALAHDSSEYFGDMLIQYVFTPLLDGTWKDSKVIQRSTIVSEGELTPNFSYLDAFSKGLE